MIKKESIPAPETAYITENKVFCDGGIGALGHPRVYLTIEKQTRTVECPYCDKCFVKREK